MPIPPDHHSADTMGAIFATTAERFTAAVSVGMIATPLWLQELKSVSEVAAILVPILGCIYLSMQIGFKLWDRTRNDE